MTTSNTCPCGSDQPFFECCEPVILGQRIAATPEELMRSRYSAYVSRAVDYIFESTHPKTRKYYSKKDISDWAKNSSWLKLEVLEAKDDQVEFRAFYSDQKGKLNVHHELSTFRKEHDKWYFLEGKDPSKQ